jgi:hypothetical protein
VVAPTRMPSLRSSPQILTQPHREFLPCHPHDEASDLRVDRRSARPVARPVGPPGSHERAMPAQQRLRRDEERCPAVSEKQAACGGEHDPVERGEPGAAGLAAQHPKLMPENEDLQVLGAVVSVWEDQQTRQQADGQPEQEEHRWMVRSACSRDESEFPRPTGGDRRGLHRCISAGQGGGRTRIRSWIGASRRFYKLHRRSPQIPFHPHLLPIIAYDVRKRPAYSFGYPLASPPVACSPARLRVGRSEGGAKRPLAGAWNAQSTGSSA